VERIRSDRGARRRLLLEDPLVHGRVAVERTKARGTRTLQEGREVVVRVAVVRVPAEQEERQLPLVSALSIVSPNLGLERDLDFATGLDAVLQHGRELVLRVTVVAGVVVPQLDLILRRRPGQDICGGTDHDDRNDDNRDNGNPHPAPCDRRSSRWGNRFSQTSSSLRSDTTCARPLIRQERVDLIYWFLVAPKSRRAV